jgi:hypothetical protein
MDMGRSATVAAVESKGRPLHIADVRNRLPTGPDNRAPSDWYVRKVMTEVGCFKIGKYAYVYEGDLERWLNSRLD